MGPRELESLLACLHQGSSHRDPSWAEATPRPPRAGKRGGGLRRVSRAGHQESARIVDEGQAGGTAPSLGSSRQASGCGGIGQVGRSDPGGSRCCSSFPSTFPASLPQGLPAPQPLRPSRLAVPASSSTSSPFHSKKEAGLAHALTSSGVVQSWPRSGGDKVDRGQHG